jgi:hypothetical protein
MADVGGALLAVFAPNHLADGLELAIILDAGAEQGRRRRQCRFGRSFSSGGPAWCHGAAGLGRISEEERMLERIGCACSL